MRQGADKELLGDPDVVNLAPLLSPVLPPGYDIEDNEVIKNMADEAKLAARIDLMVKVPNMAQLEPFETPRHA